MNELKRIIKYINLSIINNDIIDITCYYRF